ncbi:MAG: hypothetical protein IJW34_05705 [Clostridia bacterium]|nr:hypothetical protein [Clostridia bacterium]
MSAEANSFCRFLRGNDKGVFLSGKKNPLEPKKKPTAENHRFRERKSRVISEHTAFAGWRVEVLRRGTLFFCVNTHFCETGCFRRKKGADESTPFSNAIFIVLL